MDANSESVNSSRRYDSSGRRAQASRTRDAILETARRMFLADGYAATTIARVADEAGVSVETIYKAFGGKPGLVRAIRERALDGSGPIPAERRSDDLHGAEADPRAIMRGWGALTSEVAPLAAPILLLVRDAATQDPTLAAFRDELDHIRLARMTDNARKLADHGHLAAGVSVEYAAEVMWTYSAPELFELLVLRRGWSPRRYGAFVADAMIAALLPAAGGA